MNLKPWREIIVPHSDVLSGTFQQSEFAADLTAVRTGRATPEYGDARSFYERTFITEGMSHLLTQVVLRLNSRGVSDMAVCIGMATNMTEVQACKAKSPFTKKFPLKDDIEEIEALEQKHDEASMRRLLDIKRIFF